MAIRGSVGKLLSDLKLAQVHDDAFAGVLTQLSICSGILLAQAISSASSPSRPCLLANLERAVPLSKPETGRWRIIPLVSAALALIQVRPMIRAPVTRLTDDADSFSPRPS